jgi:putative NIF3 family GTP cyclohydrolase 1 type 2
MDTKKMMDMALQLAGLDEMPHDTTITVEGQDIKRVLIGIDMEVPELLLAKELDFDLVVSHHPKAETATVNFSKVMDIQIDKMMEFGIPINKAQKALRKKQKTVEIGSHVSNYDRHASAAKLLNLPYMNIHLPADLIGERFIQNYLNEKFDDQPKKTLQDIVDALNELPIYKDALANPVIRVGGPKDYAGKIAVLYAGGTNGGADVYKSYFDAGVGTIVCMHVPEDVIKAVNEQNIGNVIVAGHMPSDSIGLNAIIEAWEKQGLEVVKMSGIL